MAGPLRAPPTLLCLAAAALFGASTPASKLLLGDAARPVTLAGLLYLGAALAVLPAALRRGAPAATKRDASQLLRLGAAVVLGGCVAPVLLLVALSHAPSASVSLWLNLETVATALLGWAFFKERVPSRTWLAVALISAAGVLLATPQDLGLAPAAGLVGLAAACWGLDNNLTSVVDLAPARITLVKGAVAGVVNVGLGLVLEGAPPSGKFVLAGLGLGALSYGLSLVLYISGSQRIGATRAQAVFSTAPFVGLAIAWLVSGEPVLPVQLFAAAIMAAGLMVLLGRAEVHDHVHEHPELALVHAHPHESDLHHRHAHP